MAVKEKCGVIGVSGKTPSVEVPLSLFHGLTALQHRGQESAGITVVRNKKLRTIKAMGLVSEVFDYEDLDWLTGSVGAGHVRYSTTGTSTVDNAQPLMRHANGLQIAISFNGNIVNYEELKQRLGGSLKFSCTADTELILQLFADHLKRLHTRVPSSADYITAMQSVMTQLEGAYSLILLLSNGVLIAARDPQGYKPLCLGRKRTLVNELVYVASETVALDALDAQYDREILPGEIVVIQGTSVESKVMKARPRAHCMFEYVYFARPDSIINGRHVYQVRENLGIELARPFHNEVDVVIPVPDSGRSAALGFSRESGVPFAEGLIKNRYIHRTFIMPADSKRKSSIRLKLSPVKPLIEGKRVAIVDDSIVRGHTTRKLVKMLRSVGAKEIHLLISCPPIIAPCYMGIDFPTYKELIASARNTEQIRAELGADSVQYMSLDGLVNSIGLPREDICLSCLTDVYPTEKINAYARGRKKLERSFNIAVLVSGRGSNLQSIIDAVDNKSLHVNISVVISNRPDAHALKRAEQHGIDAVCIDSKAYSDRIGHEKAILKELQKRDVRLVVLAGYMRIVGETLLKPFTGRIINIHPTLLPKFKGCMGIHCHEQVLASGDQESGCSVHLVTSDVDGGIVLGQRRVPVKPRDTAEKLAERVLIEEHKLLPEMIKLFSEGKHGC
ncbi:amidophosphoribosyltransferase [Candidatus Micrarchaeota archaeon]|nr:amidophosphoribosyltransferase [Candidatus Micrarchaeota archaeon]